MRLDKFLCECQNCTRTEAKQFIKKGQVSVNGAVIKDAGFAVKEGSDSVLLSGKALEYKKFYYYVLNKPAGYVVSDSESDGIPAKNLLPEAFRERLKPVGRLDKDTSGILLFTDDGEFAHRLLAPKSHVSKTYLVGCEKDVTGEDLEKLRSGVNLGDGEESMPAEAEYAKGNNGAEINPDEEINPKEILLTIREGKYHQVKRMLAATCNKVTALKRIAFGNVRLSDFDLKEGEGVFTEKESIYVFQ